MERRRGRGENVLRGRPFDELFLMTVSTLGAFLIGHPEEAVGVMIFYKIGEMFQDPRRPGAGSPFERWRSGRTRRGSCGMASKPS
jgi:cation transport ATPase